MKNILRIMLAAAFAASLTAAEPLFTIPLDESAEVIGAGGAKLGAGVVHGKNTYLPGVSGKALEVTRQAYDQVTVANFTKLPAVNPTQGTVSFWFKPNWNGNDGKKRSLISGNTGDYKFRFYFIKSKSGSFDLSVCTPGQMQILGKNYFKKDEWSHIAIVWDAIKGDAVLYVNGRETGAAHTGKSGKAYAAKTPLRLFLGSEWIGKNDRDRFEALSGDGLYDDVQYFETALSKNDIFALASGAAAAAFSPVSLDAARRSAGRLDFAFSYGEARLASSRPLLALKGVDGKKKITLASMGASGKLAFSATDGKNNTSFETNCTLLLDKPVRLSFRAENGATAVYLDDARQGELRLPEAFGEIAAAEGAEGVKVASPAGLPTREETARLTADVVSAAEQPLWSMDDAARRKDGVRNRVCLNGLWRVIPVNDSSYAPPAEKWGYMRVPGSYRSPLFGLYQESKGKIVPCGWEWNKVNLIKYRAGWYQRVFEVPADLRSDGRLFLNFTDLHADNGRVYLNGKLVYSFRQDFKIFGVIPNAVRLDVTDTAKRDGANVLTVFVDRRYSGLWKGIPSIGDHDTVVINDVWLENVPADLTLKTALALPSFRQKNVTLRARVANPAGRKGGAEVRFAFTREGKVEKEIAHAFDLSGAPEQVVVFTENWENPVLWNVDEPRCYRLAVTLAEQGKTADTLPETDFGFREAWVEDGGFKLNGLPLRLRMWTCPGLNRLRYYFKDEEGARQYVAHVRELNYDTIRFDPLGNSTTVAWEEYLTACDRQGLYNLFPMPPYEDEEINGYTHEVERFLEHYGTHPNILMWYTDFNTCGYAWDQDPAKLNDTEYVPEGKTMARARVKVADKVMRGLDPTREVFQHAGGNSGKIFTSMNYQSLGVPVQEQADWPRQWAAKHTQPLMVVESAFPYGAQFVHFDDNSKGFMVAEHAARFFGDLVFRREKRPIPFFNSYGHPPFAALNANYTAVIKMLYENVVRAWRAYGMNALGDFPGGRDNVDTGVTYKLHNVVYRRDDNIKTPGVKPDIVIGWSETQKHPLTDYTRPLAGRDIIRAAYAPLLVYLGGTPEDFTNKDHAFFAGEEFQKSVVIVNDRYTEQKLQIAWEMVCGGKTLLKGEFAPTVAPGAIEKLPLALKAPEVLERTPAELRLTVARDGALLTKDTFALQFFPRRQQPAFNGCPAALFDPAGEKGQTAEMLRRAGFKFTMVRDFSDVERCRLLIIGKNSLRIANSEILQKVDSERLVEKGLNILCFEQQPCNLGNFVFESPSYRNAFIRRADSPYVAGLEDADFSDWRGGTDSVPEYVVSEERTGHYPRSKWKCGNGGIVCGHVIRKPSYGNFTAVVDCGFNLMFSPLLEMRRGHGIAVFCQLDVTPRYLKDPVATRVVDNLLTTLGSYFRPAGEMRVTYLGDADGEKMLKRMGLRYTRGSAKNLWAVSQSEVVILGANPVPEKQLAELERKISGVSVIALPGAPLEILHKGLKVEKTSLFRCEVPAGDPVFAGIPHADMYYGKARELPVVAGLPDWAVATRPAVFAKIDNGDQVKVILTVTPEEMTGNWNDEKTARVWSQIFHNLNLGMGEGLALFSGARFRANSRTGALGETALADAGLRLDPENTGKPDDSGEFKPIKIGKFWELQGFTQDNPHHQYPQGTKPDLIKSGKYDGYAWYRCPVTIPANWKGLKLTLVGGEVDDCDWTYLNGTKIGETTLENNKAPWAAKRKYSIPAKLVKFGAENIIMVRVFDRSGGGGMAGEFKIVAEDPAARPSWSPYIDNVDFYDVDAFHNW